MPTVKEMMEHLFSSDEEEEGVVLEEYLPVGKKRRLIPSPTTIVSQSGANKKASPGIVGSVGSEKVSTSQSRESESAMGNAANDSSMSYDSEDSSDTSNSGQPDKIRRSPWKAPPLPIPLVQEDMDPTKGAAVAALTTGAIISNGDVGSVGSDANGPRERRSARSA